MEISQLSQWFHAKVRWGHRMRMMFQAETAECGLACVAMAASSFNPSISMRWMRRRYPTSMRGTSLPKLAEIAADLGIETGIYAAEFKALRNFADPCILFVDNSHFILLCSSHRGRYRIHDPAVGALDVDGAELQRRFSGYLLHIKGGQPCPDIKPAEEDRWKLIKTVMMQVRRNYASVIVVTLICEVLVLVSPQYARKAFDHIYTSDQLPISMTLLLVFLSVALARALASAVKAIGMARLGAEVLARMSVEVFGKILKLPPGYFSRRHPAETISRLGSLHHLQDLVSNKLIESVIDCIVGITLILICASYDAKIGGVVLAGVVTLLLFRGLLAHRIHEASALLVARSARQDGEIIETIRAIQTIKLNRAEGVRLGRFTKCQTELCEASVELQKIVALAVCCGELTFNVVRIVVIYLGAQHVASGLMSAGALVAVAFYTELLCQRGISLAAKMLDLKVTGMHLERISDVMAEAPESTVDDVYRGTNESICWDIQCSELGFRYSDDDPWVLRDIHLKIDHGEAVALVGPSGVGKSTLLNLIGGLTASVEGELRVGGHAVGEESLRSLRRHVATVMQHDVLLPGTVVENISFFKDVPDIPLAWECLALANMADFVNGLPMGLYTLIGEQGALLSGGQRQRILLARALYRRPGILILDEATSQLDYANEKEINQALANLEMTRIIATHRVSTLPPSVRVIELNATKENYLP